jgi:hypothetical protein
MTDSEVEYAATGVLLPTQTNDTTRDSIFHLYPGTSTIDRAQVNLYQVKTQNIKNIVLNQHLQSEFRVALIAIVDDVLSMTNIVFDPKVENREWLALSEKVFESIWDNDLDAQYDNL